MAEKYKIKLTNEVDLVEEGCLGKHKDLLQVLWERGWVDERKLSEYSLKGQKHQMDAEGNMKEKYHNVVLHTLIMNCADFKEEKSAMEVVLGDTGKCTHFPYLMFSIIKIISDHIIEKIHLIFLFYFIRTLISNFH